MNNNTQKIINDPIYGIIQIKFDLVLKIINHPYFQRLRRISQLGLTDFVFPGARHTRFQHAIGAMHLIDSSIKTLRNKGVSISENEEEAVFCAILMHDIGHGPFSHTLENALLHGIHHEEISLILMNKLNDEFENKLELAIKIFKGDYHRNFFHQLVSSQLDVDRLDYLNRDSFFSGVAEGKVSAERILKMITIDTNENLLVEEKGIYSIENFLNARRLMYWQVYLHKTVISAEFMLIHAVKRAKKLIQKGENIFFTSELEPFFLKKILTDEFSHSNELIQKYISLDDTDIWYCIKQWSKSTDFVLRHLSSSLINRTLFKVNVSNSKPTTFETKATIRALSNTFNISSKDAKDLFIVAEIVNNAYISKNKKINIIKKNNTIIEIAKAVDLSNIEALSKKVKKYFVCLPREIVQN